MEYRLTTSNILAAWETGATRRPLDRALAILWAAGAAGDGDPADLPIAERDRRLLSIGAGTFGPTFPARVSCPNCSAELEMELDVGDLLQALPVTAGGNETLRALTSRDLAAVSTVPPEKLAAVLRARLAKREAEGTEADALDRQIEENARAVELTTQIACSECSENWLEVFDVATHLWAEIETTAFELLGEVSDIAAAFGWSERAILSLSPARRAIYLARARQL